MLFVVCLFFFFQKPTFSKKSFRNTCAIRVSNSLDPDQARRFVGPDLGPNSLQKLSADDTSRQIVHIELLNHMDIISQIGAKNF